MTGFLTHRFRKHNAEQFKEAFSEAANSNIYFFVGRTHPWDDENTPDSRDNSVGSVRFEPWHQMVYMKKILPADVTFAARRFDWVSGTAYRQYDSNDAFLYANTDVGFYVLEPQYYNMYKCIWNNGGANSTEKPTGTSTSIISTSDGYRWKYMYTLDSVQINNFLTTQYIPVKTLTADDGSLQWDVQAAAANGSVETIKIVSGGSGYLQVTGTLANIHSPASTIRIESTKSGVDNIYNNSDLYITAGVGAGQVRRIINYIGTTKTVQLNSAFSTIPTTSSTYRIAPRVVVTSGSGYKNGGTHVKAICTLTSGAVANVTILTPGTKFADATVRFFANTTYGSGAVARAILSPPNGHGSNPEEELGAYNVLLFSKLTENEDVHIPNDQDFRTVGIIRDPKLASNTTWNATNTTATANGYPLTVRLKLSGLSTAFDEDEEVEGQTSGATGIVVFSNTTLTKIYASNGTFQVSENIIANTSSRSANIVSIIYPQIAKYTGDIMYIENREAIIRAVDQEEELKLTCRF